MTNTPDTRADQVPPKARTKQAKRTAPKAKANPAAPKPAVQPGAVKWIVRSGSKETSVADWARSQGHKPFDVRQALRKAIRTPRVVTQAELTTAMSAPKKPKQKQ
jgi:hypothetical protein